MGLTMRPDHWRPESVLEENERLRAENEALRYAARHDSLTRLLNRDGFHERANAVMGSAEPGLVAAAAVLDLNRFKEVNDTLGSRGR